MNDYICPVCYHETMGEGDFCIKCRFMILTPILGDENNPRLQKEYSKRRILIEKYKHLYLSQEKESKKEEVSNKTKRSKKINTQVSRLKKNYEKILFDKEEEILYLKDVINKHEELGKRFILKNHVNVKNLITNDLHRVIRKKLAKSKIELNDITSNKIRSNIDGRVSQFLIESGPEIYEETVRRGKTTRNENMRKGNHIFLLRVGIMLSSICLAFLAIYTTDSFPGWDSPIILESIISRVLCFGFSVGLFITFFKLGKEQMNFYENARMDERRQYEGNVQYTLDLLKIELQQKLDMLKLEGEQSQVKGTLMSNITKEMLGVLDNFISTNKE